MQSELLTVKYFIANIMHIDLSCIYDGLSGRLIYDKVFQSSLGCIFTAHATDNTTLH